MRVDSIKRLLGSRRLTIALLLAAAVYFVGLTVLWFMDVRRPTASWMVWNPFVPWSVLFFTNLLISLFTRHYAYKGNLVLHIAFIIIAAGIVTSAFTRFSGEVTMLEGDSFYGEERGYDAYQSYLPFARVAPRVSFRMDRITAGFWGGELYFTQLEGEVSFPAETLERGGRIRLNGGLEIGGGRLRLIRYGLFPEVLIERAGEVLMKGPVRMSVFPPGSEDVFEVAGYRVFVTVLTDPLWTPGKIENLSMNVTDPAFIVRVEWLGKVLFKGPLRKGETIRVGDVSFSFTGVRDWVSVGIVRDPAEVVVFIGFIAALAGLVLRYGEQRQRARRRREG